MPSFPYQAFQLCYLHWLKFANFYKPFFRGLINAMNNSRICNGLFMGGLPPFARSFFESLRSQNTISGRSIAPKIAVNTPDTIAIPVKIARKVDQFKWITPK